jgi:hypothetical protein
MGGSSSQDPERFDDIQLEEYDLDDLEVERLRDAPSQTPREAPPHLQCVVVVVAMCADRPCRLG